MPDRSAIDIEAEAIIHQADKPGEPLNITEYEAAKVSRIRVATLRRWRRRGKGPEYYKIENGIIAYNYFALVEWLNAQDWLRSNEK